MQDDVRALAQALDEKACLEFLAQLVRFNSYSDTPGEAELARFLVDQMRSLGLEAQLQPVQGERCNAIGIWRGQGGG